jgi:HTH-type transcriptional regulator / antitoxin HipB
MVRHMRTIVRLDPMDDVTASSLGREIREARRSLGLRQEDLALVAGVSRRAVQQVESGKETARLDVVLRLVEAVGLRLILSASDEP